MAPHMTAQPDTRQRGQDAVTVHYISQREGAALLDRQAREYLGMSGDEFKRRYFDGTIPEPERFDVLRISLLIPLSEE